MFTARNNELQWMNQHFESHSMVIVEGITGVGKSEFIEHWIGDLSRTSWYSFSEFMGLEDLLDLENTRLEKRLLELQKSWQKEVDYIVWDNLHFFARGRHKATYHLFIQRPAPKKSYFYF